MAYLSDGHCTLINRNGKDITLRYPDVEAMLLDTFGDRNMVLDGEVIALGDDGKPDFNLVATRDRQTSAQGVSRAMAKTPVVYAIFDVLLIDTDDLMGVGYAARYATLQHEKGAQTWPTHLWLSPSSTDGTAMWNTIEKQGLEGLIAKAPGSLYTQGRGYAWVKLKVTHTVTCYVDSYEEGKGSRAGKVGALILKLLDDGDGRPDEWVEVGKVGTGFTLVEAACWARDLDKGGHMIVEVEFANLNRHKNGNLRLRFPALKGARFDRNPQDCQITQLDEGALSLNG
jgi:bifunctional non-homologous end joining protein LigD